MSFPLNVSQNSIQYRDPVLTELMMGYKLHGTIADKVFRRIPVYAPFGAIGQFGADFLRIEEQETWAPGDVPELTFNISRGATYKLQNYMVKSYYTAADAWQVGGSSVIEGTLVYQQADNLLLKRDYVLASYLTSTGTMTQNGSPSPA